MNFRKVTPDSIQYLKSVSLTVQAKLYIKLTKLHRVAVQNVWFNQQCKHVNVIPNYINIKSNTRSHSSEIAIKKAQKIWLNEESRHWFTVRDNLKHHLKILYSELSFKLHNVEFDLLDHKARDIASLEVHKKFLTQQKKLRSLVSNTPKSKTNIRKDDLTVLPEHTFHPRVKNLTTTVLSNNELQLLEKGLKYNISDNVTNKSLETLAVDAELAVIINKKDNVVKNLVAHEIQNIPTSCVPNHDKEIFKSLQKTIKDNDLIVSKADKGNAVVILTRNDYLDKVNDVISGNEFLHLPSDPTCKFAKEIRQSVENSDFIFPTTSNKQKILVMNPHAPKLYGLPKIHKHNIPIRPVVSYIGAPAYLLAKFLNNKIVSKISFKPLYSLKNSIHLVDRIKNINLPNRCKLLSLDVDSLFTNVPVNETLDIMTRLLEMKRLHPIEISEIVELTQICMKQNYFKFNDKIYLQTEGLAMGSPLSPLMAELFMNDFENKNIVNNNNILYYYRYVDDIIICWTGTDRQLGIFISNLNKIHPKIKFKAEFEEQNSLTFLDLSITRVNNKHQFEIYRKPTYTDTTIPSVSCHPWQHKLAAFHSFINRLMTIPLNKANYQKELKIIYQIASANGYTLDTINNIIKKKQSVQINKQLYAVPPEKQTKYKSSITYFGPPSERIAKILKSHNVNVAFKTNNSLRSICNGKDKLSNIKKSGVYELQCSDCNAKYVGQTGRSFDIRYKEHIAAFRNNKPEKSHFAKHLLDSGHNTGHSHKILHICNKGFKLNLLEQLEIIKNTNQTFELLNEQINVSKSTLLEIFNCKNKTILPS